MSNRPTHFFKDNANKWTIFVWDPDNQGVLKDADSTPTVSVRKDGASVADSVTVTKRAATTGIYDCSHDPSGELEGEIFRYEESVTVTGTTTAQATQVAGWHCVVRDNDVNVKSISDDETAADNLESQYDGTGLAGDTYPSTQAQLNNLSVGTAAVSTRAESFTKSGAEPETNTYTATFQDDGTLHIVEDVAGATDAYYQFDVGGNGVGVTVTWKGYAQSNGDSYTLYAWNWVSSAWEQIGSFAASNGTGQSTEVYDLDVVHTGTGANAGKVRFRFLSADGTAYATDRLFCSYSVVAESVGYALGAVWVDTNASNTNTEIYVDGVADNPVSTWAAALTLNTSLGLNRFAIKNGSSITLTGTSDRFSLIGVGSWTLALGGQSIEGLNVIGATVSGIGTATVTPPKFDACSIGTATIPPSELTDCTFTATVTLGSAGDFFFNDCKSGVAGSGSPTFDYNSIGSSSTVNVRNWSGGLTAVNIASTTVSSWEFLNGGTAQVNGTGGSVFVRGRPTTTTDNSGGSVTLDTSGVVNQTTISGSSPQLLQSTTIATLASQTSFTLTAGSADDDAYNNAVIVITDQSTSTQKAVGRISDYTGASKTVTLTADPGIFTMATGDTVNIVAWHPYLDAAISGVGGAAGSGSVEKTLTIESPTGTPVDGAEVWVTTDEAGLSVVAGTLHTDAMGEVAFMLDPGNYYAWKQLSGHNFTNPETFTVS